MIGSQVWKGILGSIRRHRFREYGASTEGPQCSPLLRDWHTHNLCRVCMRRNILMLDPIDAWSSDTPSFLHLN